MLKMFFLYLTSFIFAQASSNSLKLSSPAFTQEVNSLISRFSSELISVDQLDTLIQSKSKIVLLDVREKKEFDISHILNSVNIDSREFDVDRFLATIDRGQRVIVYCSVGFRSGQVADQILKRGIRVYNLYGGIFEWSNLDKPLVDTTVKTTHRVHTYNKNWAKWVTKALKVN
jgi:rhodanese-related sulfurtransferase